MVNNKLIRQAIYERLNVASVTSLLASGSASIFHAVAPPTAQFPYVVFSKQSGTMVGVFGPTGEAFKDHVWLVKGVTRDTKSGAAEDIDKAVHDRLQHGDLTISGADDMAVYRISDVEYVETVGDTQYRHCGGNYRLAVQDS